MVAFVRLCIIKSLPLRLYAFSPLVSIGSHSLKQSMGCSERDVGSASIKSHNKHPDAGYETTVAAVAALRCLLACQGREYDELREESKRLSQGLGSPDKEMSIRWYPRRLSHQSWEFWLFWVLGVVSWLCPHSELHPFYFRMFHKPASYWGTPHGLGNPVRCRSRWGEGWIGPGAWWDIFLGPFDGWFTVKTLELELN